MKAAAILFAVLFPASLAWSHGPVHDSESFLGAPYWVWGVGLGWFGMGIGAGLAGSFMAAGDWQSAYVLGGAIFGLAFVLYYLYFARLDVPEAGLEPATARSRA